MPLINLFRAVPQTEPDPEGTPLRWQIYYQAEAGTVPVVDSSGRAIAGKDDANGFVLAYEKSNSRLYPCLDVWDTSWLVLDSDSIEVPVTAYITGRPRHTGTVTVSRGGGGGLEVQPGKKKNAFQLIASYNSKRLPRHIAELLKRKL